MAEVKKYSHDIFHKPGDEGSASSDQGKTYSGADCPNEAAPAGASHEVIQKPGDEGSELGKGGMLADNVMGYQNVPPAPMDGFLQGPEVRRTRVAPVTGANPYGEMPGAST